ncbi:hypothetical protein [Lysinibacillus boronitolerans]|uniref:hypothetical protein n=1 Tax=Lysinibacillus boronitolerans TaxID=309788 RepID=UPI00068BA613|nr:hypothetical protein [Lysinibacillus boronitolerans]
MEDKIKIVEGISVALAFFICSILLYLNPTFLGNEFITSLIGAVLGFIGIVGFLLEISKVFKESLKSAIIDVGVALFFGTILVLLHYFFSNIFVNWVIIILLLIVIYGFFRGVLKIVILSNFNGKNILLKVPLLLLNLSVFTVSILQILKMFKIL